jgi:hypothetical protein
VMSSRGHQRDRGGSRTTSAGSREGPKRAAEEALAAATRILNLE